MSFMKKMHELSIHMLNLCAIATLVSLAVNVMSAVVLYIMDHRHQEEKNP